VDGSAEIPRRVADIYSSLSDDRNARFNGLGRQLFAENQE
jgi:hypothetical protein